MAAGYWASLPNQTNSPGEHPSMGQLAEGVELGIEPALVAARGVLKGVEIRPFWAYLPRLEGVTRYGATIHRNWSPNPLTARILSQPIPLCY